LRDLQDIYSEPINLAGGSGEETDVDLEDGGGNSREAERENAPREGGQSHPIEDTSNLSQTGFRHRAVDVGRVVDKEAGNPKTSMFDTKLSADEVRDYTKERDNVKSAAVQSLSPYGTLYPTRTAHSLPCARAMLCYAMLCSDRQHVLRTRPCAELPAAWPDDYPTPEPACPSMAAEQGTRPKEVEIELAMPPAMGLGLGLGMGPAVTHGTR
jgi:hypothetical protein